MSKILKKIIQKQSTPFFVYQASIIRQNIKSIKTAAVKHGLKGRVKIFCAYFCNSHPVLFKEVIAAGAGILLQSPEEFAQIKKNKLIGNHMVSPSFLSDNEIEFWTKKNLLVNLASLEEVKYFIQHHPKQPLSFRIDLTAKGGQRLAIKRSQLLELKKILDDRGITPEAFQVYVGTGSSLKKMIFNARAALVIFQKYFPNARSINLGGGFKFDYAAKGSDEKHFSWASYFSALNSLLSEFKVPKSTAIILEPGRDIFADSGQCILSIKRLVKQGRRNNIATDGSYVYAPSSTIRKRQHQVDFFSSDLKKLRLSSARGVLSGCTTLSSDFIFPGSISIPKKLESGDFVIIQDLGAYAATQHLSFLNKKPCAEVLIKNQQAYLITRSGKDIDKIRYVLLKPKRL